MPLTMGSVFGHRRVYWFGVVLVNFGNWKFEGLGLNWLIVWGSDYENSKIIKLGKIMGLGQG